jgi:hypothetical protein
VWAFGRYDLGLGDDWLETTSPEMFSRLVERKNEADRRRDMRAAQICGLLAGKPWEDFMPRFKSKEEEGDPVRAMAERIKRAHLAMTGKTEG